MGNSVALALYAILHQPLPSLVRALDLSRFRSRSTRCIRPDDDLRASEIRSSREQFEAYGEKLMPILSDMGIEFSAEPEIFEVQNLVKR
jgi:hypothetical protein